MAYDWLNITQQQLQGQPQLNGPTGMNAISQMNPSQQLRTGKNPNPKFPRLRHAWEGTKEFFGGTPEKIEQYPTITPQQQGIMQLLQQLGIYDLQNPYEGFEPIAQQARTQFSQETVPGLAERFTSMGNNALSSGAFTSQLNQGRAALESNLVAQKAQYGQQNKQQALQMLMSLLNPQSENIHRPRQPGAGERAVEFAIQAALKALTAGAL